MIPSPPPGFDTDVTPQPNSAGSVPPPPPGFDQDITPPAESGYRSPDYSPGGLVGGAFNEVTGAAKGIWNNAKDIPQLASDVYQTGKQIPSILSGKTNVIDTPMGNRMINSAMNAAPVAQGMQTAAEHPIDWAYQHPIATASILYGGYKGAKSLFDTPIMQSEMGGGFGPKTPPPEPPPPAAPTAAPNYLEKTGGANLNSQMGIRGSTIEKLTPRGENPGTFGVKFAQDLQSKGLAANSPTEAFSKLSPALDKAGQAVGSAKQAIANEAAKYGAIASPLEVDAETALQPLQDAWQSTAKHLTGVGKDVAQYLGDIHDNLSKFAEGQGGKLTLDNIDQAMSEVGKYTHAGSEANQLMNREAFHALADTRDHIVQNIADTAQNPSLKSNLLQANKQYSQLIRILPDVRKAAAREVVGQKSLSGMVEDLKNATLSRGMSQAGQALKGSAPALKGSSVPIFAKGAFTAAESDLPNISFSGMKTLTPQMAKDFLKRAGGDKDAARKMASDEGYSF